jgi:6-phosphogluconolactonase (cycloisomerase 2 family)
MKSRQEAPHAHCATLDPTGRYLVSNDLGADKIYVYRFDSAHRTLAPADPAFFATAPGAGPRHFAFSPTGPFAYAVTELASTVLTFRWDDTRGSLQLLQTQSLLDPGFKGTSMAAEVSIDAGGRHLYACNRGEDTVVVYSIDPKTGKLTLVQRLRDGINFPRTFAFDATGRWLIVANTNASSVGVYRVDSTTGKLSPTGITRTVPKPLCVVFVPRT